eukprot:9499963-Pyramimonas_sp.AAC.1
MAGGSDAPSILSVVGSQSGACASGIVNDVPALCAVSSSRLNSRCSPCAPSASQQLRDLPAR